MIAKDTWTDCPQKVYDKLAKLSVDDLELVCMEYHSDITSDLVTNLTWPYKMKDLEILKQLLNGNHLNDKELKRAKELIKSLQLQINN